MKSIWKKCLGLTASLLAVSAQAADSSGSEIIARSPGQPVASLERPVVGTRPTPVTLERPRPSAFAVQQVTYQQPLVRAQAAEPGFAEAPTPKVVPTLPAPSESFPTGPQMLGADAVPALDGGMVVDGMDPDRYGVGDGVSRRFNNLFNIEAEALLWHMRGQRLPPLVTTGLVTPPPFALAALTMPTAQTVFGGNTEDTGMHSGERIRGTLWIDRDHAIGVEGSFFLLNQESTNFSRTSDGSSVLGIPFLGLNGEPRAVVLAGDGRTVGGVSAVLKDRLWGAELNVRSNILSGPTSRLDLIGGFRALGLDDSFDLDVNRTTGLGAGMVVQTAHDSFAARNRFYGGQIGAEGEWQCGRWSLGVTSKLALGNTEEKVEISGGNTRNGVPTAGGIFAQATNSNVFHKNRFSLVPEVNVKVGYQLSDYLRATIGYNFLYWTDVARGAEQIDPVLLGTGRPAFASRTSDFWTQGVTLGLELRY